MLKKIVGVFSAILCILIGGFLYSKKDTNMATIKVISAAFQEGQMIPKKYSCKGDNISPEISWSGAPAQTKSFALICDDPDAPKGTWVHWVVFNIPAHVVSLPEGVDPVSLGATVGKNSWGSQQEGFGGPCPPSGVHRYFFTVYAVDQMLNFDKNATKEKVLAALQGHIAAQGQLMGRFSAQ